jgi:hypothetical protein
MIGLVKTQKGENFKERAGCLSLASCDTASMDHLNTNPEDGYNLKLSISLLCFDSARKIVCGDTVCVRLPIADDSLRLCINFDRNRAINESVLQMETVLIAIVQIEPVHPRVTSINANTLWSSARSKVTAATRISSP